MNTAFELDDLKATLQSLDRRLERQQSLQMRTMEKETLTRVRSRLQPLAAGQAIQIVCGVLLSLLSGLFWVEHVGALHLMIYGLSLHAYGLMFIVFAVRDLVLINRIDHAAPVVLIQKQLAELRAWHLRAGLWFAVAGCFMWTPLMLVIFYWLGADLWVHKPAMVYGFIASSFVCLGLSYGLVRWSRRPGREKLAKAIANSSAGRSLTRAQAALAELREFERE